MESPDALGEKQRIIINMSVYEPLTHISNKASQYVFGLQRRYE